ncbi:hypothetical protein AVEN_68858-1 [Araneus ventricosus]|uniref:Uncharacterized protein n=1 Tax=Araneus ventricosus TaxID=182803 RepID=A0A4Y2C553_ARAVE|nr:hypothetical protein AVEN_68858-1 [Araneus ventricosus]
MSAILKNKRILDDEKDKKYMQVLQKRLNIQFHNNGDQETIPEPVLAQHTEEEKQDLGEDLERMHLDFYRRIDIQETQFKELKRSGLDKNLQTASASTKPHTEGFDMLLQGLSQMNFPETFHKEFWLRIWIWNKKRRKNPSQEKENTTL